MRRRVGLLAVLLLTLSLPTWGTAESQSGPGARGQAAAATGGAAARLDQETPAEGAPVPEYRLAEGGQDRSLLWDGARMVLSLAAVLVLLGLGVKALRRWPVLTGRSVAAGPLEVLGRLSLGAKEAVCLVRAGNEVLALGISAAGVNLLCRLDGAAVGAQPSMTGARSSAGPGPGLLPSGRLRELAARLRDVQTAWGLPRADAEDRR
jgi:flagellar biogenesis protein FliO